MPKWKPRHRWRGPSKKASPSRPMVSVPLPTFQATMLFPLLGWIALGRAIVAKNSKIVVDHLRRCISPAPLSSAALLNPCRNARGAEPHSPGALFSAIFERVVFRMWMRYPMPCSRPSLGMKRETTRTIPCRSKSKTERLRVQNKKSGQELRDELNRIKALQQEWNALSLADRVSLAKRSPDLSAFFRGDMESRNK